MADVELTNIETQACDPVPPVLEHAKLGHLYLFQEELQGGSYLLDFRAGQAVYSNRTPLHLAAMHGHHEIVKFIMNHPDISREVVNAKDCFGNTPLHLAILAVHVSVVKLLTESSLVYPDRFLTTTSSGYTPLHLAVIEESPDIARLLLRQHCQVQFSHDPVNILAVSWHGHTPLDIARQKRTLTHLGAVQKEKIEELVELLESSDQNWLQQGRERISTSANAITVGAALVAAVMFELYLQLPGGTWTSSSGTPSTSPASSGNAWERLLEFFLDSYVMVAFFFFVAALLIGIFSTYPDTRSTLKAEVQQLRMWVSLARMFLSTAILAFIHCFCLIGFMRNRIPNKDISYPPWVLMMCAGMCGLIWIAPSITFFIHMCQISIPFKSIRHRNAFYIVVFAFIGLTVGEKTLRLYHM